MRVKMMAAILAGLAIVPTAARAELIDRVLAVVNGSVITQSDVTAALEFGLVQVPSAKGTDPIRAALDQLIRRELILSEVNRFAITEPDAEVVKKRIADIRSKYSSERAFDEALATVAMTPARLQTVVEASVRIEEYLGQRFAAMADPTDEEVADFYSRHRDQFARGGQVPPLADVRDAVRQRLTDERRSSLIEDWVNRLRRRAEVSDLYFAGSNTRATGGRSNGESSD
jgi:peptidyl-prolyl cis-trans isomerase SurA